MTSKHTVICQNPEPAKHGTRIAEWKFDLVRNAILEALRGQPAGVEFKKLPALVRMRIPHHEIDRLGSVPWYTTVVKLHMEAVSEIERVPGVRPQRLRMAAR